MRKPRRHNPAGRGADDAQILAWAKTLPRLEQAWLHELRELDALRERYVEPPPPAALIRVDSDLTLGLGVRARIGHPFDDEDVRRLREYLEYYAQNRRQLARMPESMRERMRTIIAASREWQKAKHAALRAAGVVACERRARRYFKKRAHMYSTAGRTPAKTEAGVLAKLLLASVDVATFVQEFGDSTAVEYVLASAVADAIELLGSAEHAAQLQVIRKGLEEASVE